ncbi:iron complex transport system permease protein [Aliiroseovarius halocynthiae]|nr:iron complex transport system permease protein [Aliiroseovarius halocynthiae]
MQPSKQIIFLFINAVAVAALFWCSLAYGVVSLVASGVLDAFIAFDGSREHLIIIDTRLPRAVLAVIVGASLGAAGAIMQALARNPIAAPELLGVNHGAALFVAAGSFLLTAANARHFVLLALAGAGVAAALSYLISLLGPSRTSSTKLVLAGAAVTSISAALIQLILILHAQTLDEMRFWLAGSLIGRDITALGSVAPILVVGGLISVLVGPKLNIFASGDITAQSLGLHIVTVRVMAVSAVVLLAGSAVALAGPIAFIGLAAPHMVRGLAGADHRWIIVLSASAGAALLLFADLAARFVVPGQEIPVGIMTALIGIPFFLAQVRKGSLS